MFLDRLGGMITHESRTERIHTRQDFDPMLLCAAETAPCECPDACERDHTNE